MEYYIYEKSNLLEDLFIEREQVNIKNAQREDLFVEREQVNIKNAQLEEK